MERRRNFCFILKFFGLSDKKTIFGRGSRDDIERYIQDLNQLKGIGRVWFVFSHNYNWGAVDEQEYFLTYLGQIGKRLDRFTAQGSSLYLYEL